MLKKALLYILIILAGCFFFNGLMNGQEQFECRKWQGYANEFEDFYLVEWQANQCNHHGIKIDAPIKK